MLFWGAVFFLSAYASSHANELTDLKIQADSVSIDKQTQMSRYSGHVKMSYENKQLLAETVDLFFQKGALNKIIATGQPVSITLNNDNETVKATAGEVIFLLVDKKIQFQYRVQLTRNEDHFSGETIEYDLSTQSIKASKSASGTDQVEIVIKAPSQQTSKQKTPSPSTDHD